jgi:hypothetical protein
VGDRANIYLTQASDTERGIYLYTHWSGYRWPERLREALEFGKGRWNDSQYLARIITSRVFAELVDETVSGGIGLEIGDNERPITIVDLDGMTVSFSNEGQETQRKEWTDTRSFADYVAQEKADYPRELASQRR